MLLWTTSGSACCSRGGEVDDRRRHGRPDLRVRAAARRGRRGAALRVSDEGAFAVGLTCGGIIDILVEPVCRTTWPELDDLVATSGRTSRVDEVVVDDARRLLAAGASAVLDHGEGMEVFVQSWAPRAWMVIFGAVDFAAAFAAQGNTLGHHVTVCDARAVFATRARFPDVDEVIVDWPHRWLAAQVVATRWGGSGQRLGDAPGRIHHDPQP